MEKKKQKSNVKVVKTSKGIFNEYEDGGRTRIHDAKEVSVVITETFDKESNTKKKFVSKLLAKDVTVIAVKLSNGTTIYVGQEDIAVHKSAGAKVLQSNGKTSYVLNGTIKYGIERPGKDGKGKVYRAIDVIEK